MILYILYYYYNYLIGMMIDFVNCKHVMNSCSKVIIKNGTEMNIHYTIIKYNYFMDYYWTILNINILSIYILYNY